MGRLTVGRLEKNRKEEETMAPGSIVEFVDREGNEHNALILHVWVGSLNIAYVGTEEDSHGRVIVRETSVPWHENGLGGFYVKKPGN